MFVAIFFVHIILRGFDSLPPLPLPASPDRSPDKLVIKALVPKIAAKRIKWHRMSYLKNTEISIISVKWSLFVPLLLSACTNSQKVLVATCSTAIYGIYEIYVRLCVSVFLFLFFVFRLFCFLYRESRHKPTKGS